MEATNKPLISIIIPAYNAGQYISKCIDSVIAQSYTNLDIIIINDCSFDNTLSIIHQYNERDNRINIIDLKENNGVSFARNYGVQLSRGEYIAFVDADDYLEPTMIEKLYESIRNTDSDIAICGFDYVDDKGVVVNNNPTSPIKNEALNKEELFYSLMKENYWFYITPFNRLCKREIASKLTFKVGHRYEDEIYAHELFDLCSKATCISDILYHYVQHDGSFISSGGNLYDHIDCFYDRYKFFKKKKYYEISKDSLYRAVEFYKTVSKNEVNYIKKRFHYLFILLFKTGFRLYEIKYKFTSVIYLLKFLIKDLKNENH